MNLFVTRLQFSIPLRMQIERRRAFSKAFNFIYFNKIEGAYIEFGVASGMTLNFALLNAKARKMNQMNFFGVDTFLGFPETNGPETDFKSYKSIVGSRNFSMKMVKRVLSIGKAKNLHLFKLNMESDSLKELEESLAKNKVAIAHLDMDYYSPTLNALSVLSESFSIGSILMFDNYFFFGADDNMGERRALIEFKESHPKIIVSDYFTYGWHGKAFVVSSIG
jgi:hypothetical protein